MQIPAYKFIDILRLTVDALPFPDNEMHHHLG